MEKTRYLEWVSVSMCVGEAGALLIDAVNGLGLIDDQLIPKEFEFTKRFEGWGMVVDSPVDLELRILSHLWVLGGYEVVRQLADWTKDDPTIGFAKWRSDLVALKRQFERLRVPLAKQEVARHFKTDFALAFPTIVPGHGVGWHVSGDTVISRRALSDELLNMLRKIHDGT